VTASAASNGDYPLEAPLPASPLESIVRTEDLQNRPRRPPDHAMENSALADLVSSLADSPSTVLQTLADKALEVLHADSAGLSLLTKDKKRFYWAAIAGAWRPHIGGGTPRDFGPCGDVLDRNIPMLFTHWERRYPYLSAAMPLADEGLLVPFYVNGEAVGTIWAISHNNLRRFDTEDIRLLESLGRFASVAYRAVKSIEDLKLEIDAREEAEAKLRQLADGLEVKIRRLVDSNIIGIIFWRLDGPIFDANDAFLRIVGYDRNDLVSGRLSWRKLTPAEWRDADDGRVAQLKTTGIAQPYEKEYFHKNGSRVPVLVGGTALEGASDEGLSFVLDLTDRKRAESAVRESERRYSLAQMELAHANRIATMGHLSASIAHEIHQPIGAAIAYANAASRWLDAQPPNLQEVRRALDFIVESGVRAGEVIERTRALVKKAPPRKDRLELNETILEVIALIRDEAAKKRVSVRTQLAEATPAIQGDRVQVQQVMLNLLINSIDAMSGMNGALRELWICTAKINSGDALVVVRDSGPGLGPEGLERPFEAFYTTKSGGLGMGLSICRSIIEAHGGQIWATTNVPQGAIFQFILPAYPGGDGASSRIPSTH
jgi:PAS domain S-box-containing protein